MDFTGNRKTSRYRGFSTANYENNNTFRITDVDVIRTDLMNHIFTRRGDRVMMPRYGTIIPDLVFEPLTEDVLQVIKDELIGVVEYDPRVSLIDINVDADIDTHTVTVSVAVFYIELNVSDSLDFNLAFNESF